mmetsp:Transcript_27977/g.32264  ORF Transcript_27977/g.32264 Transcript_27977/m.32264 type:complete len:115 (+) Transcript_27977:96-440(+)
MDDYTRSASANNAIRSSGSSAPLHHTVSMNDAGIVNRYGVTMTPEQVRERNKKRGLCEKCGTVKTHKKKYLGLGMEPICDKEKKCLSRLSLVMRPHFKSARVKACEATRAEERC